MASVKTKDGLVTDSQEAAVNYFYRVEERDGLFFAMKGQEVASRGYKRRNAAANEVQRIHREDALEDAKFMNLKARHPYQCGCPDCGYDDKLNDVKMILATVSGPHDEVSPMQAHERINHLAEAVLVLQVLIAELIATRRKL